MTSLTESKLIDVEGTSLQLLDQEEKIPEETNKESNDLLEENQQLRKELQKTDASIKNCDSQISELKSEIESLKEMLCVTQKDVADLKVRMDVANEEYKKLYAEKARTEKKYEKLVKKCQGNKGKRNSESSCDLSSDYLGELDPLPPFPILM